MRLVLVLPALLMLAACTPSQNTDNVVAMDDQASDNATDAPLPLIFCDEVGERTTRDDCDYYTDLAARTQSGLGAFNAPDPMRRGQTVTLQLVLSYAPRRPRPPRPPPRPPAWT